VRFDVQQVDAAEDVLDRLFHERSIYPKFPGEEEEEEVFFFFF
jgi:hypothetical protein